jgi:hypothetical protein
MRPACACCAACCAMFCALQPRCATLLAVSILFYSGQPVLDRYHHAALCFARCSRAALPFALLAICSSPSAFCSTAASQYFMPSPPRCAVAVLQHPCGCAHSGCRPRAVPSSALHCVSCAAAALPLPFALLAICSSPSALYSTAASQYFVAPCCAVFTLQHPCCALYSAATPSRHVWLRPARTLQPLRALRLVSSAAHPQGPHVLMLQGMIHACATLTASAPHCLACWLQPPTAWLSM